MNLKIALHAIAQETFRDQADGDYISARMNYQMELREQFLWASLQACEKYLKAILLFNEKSARFCDGAKTGEQKKRRPEFGHDLLKLLVAVQEITDLPLDKPEWLTEFLGYLNRFGNNRYLSIATYAVGDELRRIDEVVWTLRRLCQSFDWFVTCGDGPENNHRPRLLAQISNPERRKNPALERPFGAIDGHLEKVLKRPHRDMARRALVWNNLFFANRQRHRLSYLHLSSSANPPQTRDWFNTPAITQVIEEYVKF
jgi:hypothetical protein